MRTRLTAFLFTALLLISRISCAAQAMDDAVSPADGACPAQKDILNIVRDKVFDGMDRSYQNGYVPVACDGYVEIILPLVADEPIEGDCLTVTAGPGMCEGSPFIFSGCSCPVYVENPWDEQDNETVQKSTSRVFVIRLSLAIRDAYAAGSYPVEITASGRTVSGRTFHELFTICVVVPASDPVCTQSSASDNGNTNPSPVSGAQDQPDATPPVFADGEEAGIADDETDSEAASIKDELLTSGGGGSAAGSSSPTPNPAPRLILTAHQFEPSTVTAGAPFTLHVAFENMSRREPILNAVISVAGDSGVLSGDGPAALYFNQIGPRETVHGSTLFTAQEDVGDETHAIQFSGTYEDRESKEYSFEYSVSFEIQQPLRIDWDPIQAPTSAHAGETISIGAHALNLGRSDARNVRVQLEAPGLVPEESLFLGNMASGEAGAGDVYAFVDVLPEGDGYGVTSGTVTLTAEDNRGEQLVMTQPFEMRIEPPIITVSESEEPEEESGDGLQWGIACAGVGGAAALLAALLYWKHRKISEA